MTEEDILYQNGPYWVCKGLDGVGYEVLEDGITHATRVFYTSEEGEAGLQKAKTMCDRFAGSGELPW